MILRNESARAQYASRGSVDVRKEASFRKLHLVHPCHAPTALHIRRDPSPRRSPLSSGAPAARAERSAMGAPHSARRMLVQVHEPRAHCWRCRCDWRQSYLCTSPWRRRQSKSARGDGAAHVVGEDVRCPRPVRAGGALRSGQTSCAEGGQQHARQTKGSGDQHAFPSGRGFYENRSSVGIHTKCTRSRRKMRPRGATNTIPRPGRREADVPRRVDGHLGTRVGALSGKVRPTQRRAARRRREGAPRRRSSARTRASASGSPPFPLPKRSTQ